MSVFKCKMCGGDLHVKDGMKIVECEFCDTIQTIPNADDEKKVNLFNRANRLRLISEFDKAAGIYESIIAEYPNEAEAYWGLCLCKYGIEYVDDPKTAKKIPTCHRTSFESIFDDNNFKLAINNSDVVAKEIYQKEAQVIDDLQKDILSIVSKEKPFDVFICYKETDENGNRTSDSVLAHDIYEHLTEKGLKVFFSRITLEYRLGQEYEPYIFAALNSAKVMLAIGTSNEYFNAVWVKNEWMRFLSLMRNDKSKVLIPCYKDIDPYDMPLEFKNLQGQDMAKLGFIQDLTRGIEKILGTKSKNNDKIKAKEENLNGKIASILKRCEILLEDGDFDKARKLCDDLLNEDPENAEIYEILLLCDFKTTYDGLFANPVLLEENKNFSKIMKFGCKELKDKYNVINNHYLEDYCEKKYNEGCTLLLKEDESIENLLKLKKTFEELSDLNYKDSKEKLKVIQDTITHKYGSALSSACYKFHHKDCEEFINIFSDGHIELMGFWENLNQSAEHRKFESRKFYLWDIEVIVIDKFSYPGPIKPLDADFFGKYMFSIQLNNENIVFCSLDINELKGAVSLFNDLKERYKILGIEVRFMNQLINKNPITGNSNFSNSNSNNSKNGCGCYVATCVYNSYDCPQVWRLRRYRDEYLDTHWWGRLFIKIYYAISPTMVKWFGNKNWFRKPIKKFLDKQLVKLEKKGYEDTPYIDKY